MKTRALVIFLAGLMSGAFFADPLGLLGRKNVTKVHTLTAPLVLVSSQPARSLHLLPVGTTLYFERSFPEGFTRYKIYLNVDRMPLALRDLEDPTEVDPLEARALQEAIKDESTGTNVAP